MLKPWWQRFPGRLKFEQQELLSLGITPRLDRAAFAAGKVELHLQALIEGETLDLIARYPDSYPYFRFEIYAPSLDLPHHQNPFLKNLCLISGSTEAWHTTDTLAGFLQTQLPAVLRSARAARPEDAAAVEIQQAEPISAYYTYLRDSIVLVDGSWELDPSVQRGELRIAIDPSLGETLRGVVEQVLDTQGHVLAQAHPRLTKVDGALLSGRWIRMPETVRENDPRLIDKLLASLHSQLGRPRWQSFPNTQIDIIAVVQPEERSWRATQDGWLFLVRVRKDRPGFRPGRYWTCYLARTGWAGESDLSARIPELATLRAKTVAIIGLGCVGAASAVEFARVGVGKLHLMDGDTVDPGTTVRWPLGLHAAGKSKSYSLAHFIQDNFPYTDVEAWHRRLGELRSDGESDTSAIKSFLSGVDLVFDASAEFGVNHFLSYLAREIAIPYMAISTTPGAWGGRVTRIVPSRTIGCWMCLLAAVSDETIPPPPSDSRAPVQPAGCSAPTFTGASFDATEVSLSGVRVAVGTLCAGAEDAYPDFEWDVAILSLRESNGSPICPRWQTFSIPRNPACPACSITK
jgi:molybdopterin/thiamine biosynthesis adenylyltransferase